MKTRQSPAQRNAVMIAITGVIISTFVVAQTDNVLYAIIICAIATVMAGYTATRTNDNL